MRCWPSYLSIEELAQVAGVALSQARRWVRAGVLVPAAKDGKRYVYSRDDALLGAVLRKLQHVLGEKSPVPMTVAIELRPLLRGTLHPLTTHAPQPVAISIAHAGWEIEISADELDEVGGRLDALAQKENE